MLRLSAIALFGTLLQTACNDDANEPPTNGLPQGSCTEPAVGNVPAGTTHPTLTSVEHEPLSGTPYAAAISTTGAVMVTRLQAASTVRATQPSSVFSTPLAVGPLPSQIRISPNGATAYVNSQSQGSITFIDMATNQVAATLPVTARRILTFGLSPDGTRLYTLTNDIGLAVVDVRTRTVIDRIQAPDTVINGQPRAGAGFMLTGIAFHPFSPCMYVAALDEGAVRTVDLRTNKVVGVYSVSGARLQNVAVSPDGATLFATDIQRSKLISWDLTSVSPAYVERNIGSLGQEGNVFDVAVTPDNTQVYVTTLDNGKIYVLDRATLALTDSVMTGGRARHIAFTPTGDGVVVPNEAGFVTFVSAAVVPPGPCVPPTTGSPPGGAGHPTLAARDRVDLIDAPFGVAVSPSGVVYVTQLDARAVSRADLPATTFGTPFAVGDLPSQVRMHPDGQTAYVSNQNARTITFVNVATNQPFDTLLLPGVPGRSILSTGLAPDGSRLYALTDFMGVYVVSTASRAVIDSIPQSVTGNLLTGVAFHPFAPCVYLAARDEGRITVVNTQSLGFVRAYTTGGNIQNVAVSADGATLFATEFGSSRLLNWNLTTGSPAFEERNIATSTQRAFDVAVTPDNVHLYVTAVGQDGVGNGRIYVLNRFTRTLVDSVVTGGAPRYISFKPDGTYAVISNEAGWVNFLH